MKKILLITTLVGISGLVHAITISAPSSLIGNNVLNGNNAYSWGISIPLASGQTVISASVNFVNVTLTAGNGTGVDYLYTDLLNSQTTGVNGVTTKTDNDAVGDYWATQLSGANITSLGRQTFTALNTPMSWSYSITGSALAALNSYLAVGTTHTFNIGIDPDCYYTVPSGGFSFTYTLSPTTNNVPDGAMTAFLALISLAGLEAFRRQFAVAKA